jgi:hypothetical protein
LKKINVTQKGWFLKCKYFCNARNFWSLDYLSLLCQCPRPHKRRVNIALRMAKSMLGRLQAGGCHSSCHGCHGVDATGTDVAPNLVDRVGLLTPRAFVTKVLTSYRLVLPDADTSSSDSAKSRESMIDEVLQQGRKGRQGRQGRFKVVMPAWEGDPIVNPHVLDIFAYLSARADGKLGVGKPTLLVNKKRDKNNRLAKAKANKK